MGVFIWGAAMSNILRDTEVSLKGALQPSKPNK